MSYIGNQPAESYASFERQVFTIVNSQTAYTLTHAVTNENDIRLVINSVVQEPGSGKAYTAANTTLTLSAALVNGTDEMYCVYLGRALQTVNPPNASVGNSQTAPTIITGQTAETSIATDDTILIHDTSASALRKMTRANFVSGIGGTNTPAFNAYQNAAVGTTLTQNTFTKVVFDSEYYDTNNAFSSGRFTVPSGEAGKYSFSSSITMRTALAEINVYLYKNGSGWLRGGAMNSNIGSTQTVTGAIDLSVGDYVEVFCKQNQSSNQVEGLVSGTTHSYFHGYKIIE